MIFGSPEAILESMHRLLHHLVIGIHHLNLEELATELDYNGNLYLVQVNLIQHSILSLSDNTTSQSIN